MGKLADLAKAKALKGRVHVTFKDGTSRTFTNEAEAEKATAGLTLEHRRGAFFEAEALAATAPVEKKKR